MLNKCQLNQKDNEGPQIFFAAEITGNNYGSFPQDNRETDANNKQFFVHHMTPTAIHIHCGP